LSVGSFRIFCILFIRRD